MKTVTATSAQAVPSPLNGKTQQEWQLGLAKRAITKMIELPDSLAVRGSGLVKDLLFTPDELATLSGILKADYRVEISAEQLSGMTLGKLADSLPERRPFRIIT